MRSTDWSSDIGFASRTTRARGSSSGMPSFSTSPGAAKLQPRISDTPGADQRVLGPPPQPLLRLEPPAHARAATAA